MASVPNESASELVAACARLKIALTLVQCAVLDLHEAFLQKDRAQRDALQRQARSQIDRIRKMARDTTRP
jgi:hypothetical protein